MQLKTIIILLIILLSSTFSFSQLKGKAKHLPGTWVYQQGSGYEIWELENGSLVGAGYRTNKIGDTVRVETLGITLVKKYLYYTFETGKGMHELYDSYSKRQFISNRRKLDFTSTENQMPIRMKYTFGFFNKNKMIISIYMAENVKKTKLILRKLN